MPQSDIKIFIDFFFEAAQKIRSVKAEFVRGKDGNLVKLALKNFSRQQLEMLAVWFLDKKRKMAPTIGAMLSKATLEELERTIKKPSFFGELDSIYEMYYKKPTYRKFTSDQLTLLKNSMIMNK
jgi:hypothetical protein